MANKRIPIRTCICCRQEFNKHELLRIVKNKSGQIKIDYEGKAEGRGAYFCSSEACLKKLNKAKMLDRMFKMQVPKEIYQQIEEDIIGREN